MRINELNIFFLLTDSNSFTITSTILQYSTWKYFCLLDFRILYNPSYTLCKENV